MSIYVDSFKFVIVGDSTVGKTSLLLKYFEDKFSFAYYSTMGVDYFSKELILGDHTQKIQVWDTAGQERFKSMTQNYIRDAQGIFLVYDITARKTFESLTVWLNVLGEYAMKNMKIMILGNKCDDTAMREVNEEQGKKFAKDNKAAFYETSAKENVNIKKAFEKLFMMVYDESIKGNKRNDSQSSKKSHESNKSGKQKIKKMNQNEQCTKLLCCSE